MELSTKFCFLRSGFCLHNVLVVAQPYHQPIILKTPLLHYVHAMFSFLSRQVFVLLKIAPRMKIRKETLLIWFLVSVYRRIGG